MLPVTEKRVVVIPHSLAAIAALTCLAMVWMSDPETDHGQEVPVAYQEAVESHFERGNGEAASNASHETRNSGSSRDGRGERVRLPEINDWTSILLPGRRSGN